MPVPAWSSAGRLFAAALLESLTRAALLIGMWLQYGLQATR